MKISYLIFSLIFLANTTAWAIEIADKQLIVVKSNNINSSTATLQRYQRENTQQPWQTVGTSIPVVVGKNGLARNKKEGDGRTPIGEYSFGPAFGFATGLDFNIKSPYFPITKTTVCVDDVKSRYYNQIIDSSKVAKDSWHSGEQMREQIPSYKWGLVVNYNYPNPKSGAGSCIFMHVWKKPGHGTAGCIAMSEDNMKQLLSWIDVMKNPLLRVELVKSP